MPPKATSATDAGAGITVNVLVPDAESNPESEKSQLALIDETSIPAARNEPLSSSNVPVPESGTPAGNSVAKGEAVFPFTMAL